MFFHHVFPLINQIQPTGWLTEILETFPRLFSFRKSRVKENGGNRNITMTVISFDCLENPDFRYQFRNEMSRPVSFFYCKITITLERIDGNWLFENSDPLWRRKLRPHPIFGFREAQAPPLGLKKVSRKLRTYNTTGKINTTTKIKPTVLSILGADQKEGEWFWSNSSKQIQ